jgi:hypothetical protein
MHGYNVTAKAIWVLKIHSQFYSFLKIIASRMNKSDRQWFSDNQTSKGANYPMIQLLDYYIKSRRERHLCTTLT